MFLRLFFVHDAPGRKFLVRFLVQDVVTILPVGKYCEAGPSASVARVGSDSIFVQALLSFSSSSTS